VAADYSNIEGRVLAWLAGEAWKLDAFRAYDNGTGHDLYIKSYAQTFGTPLFAKKDPRRQVGKTMELAGGFQGAHGAYLKFLTDETLAQLVHLVRGAVSEDDWGETAARYNRSHGLTLEQWTALSIVINRWREKHPAIKQFWYDMEEAAVRAVQDRGSVTRCRRIAFKVAGSFLMMRLPSGRYLAYPRPEIREFDVPWGGTKAGLTYFSTIDPSKRGKIIEDPANSTTWARIKTYSGMLAENATQAAARDVLADALPRLEAAGYPIVLTVHDEVVCEVPEGHGSVEEMEKIMCTLPEWASGLPVAAEGFEGRRYRK
jgi:DNA polymerase